MLGGVTLANAPFKRLTWTAWTFNLVAFPIAVFYFVLTAVGIALSIGLLIVIVGFFIGYGVIWLIHGMAPVEGWLVSKLLNTPVRASLPEPSGSFLERYRKLVSSPATWLRVGYVPLKLVLASFGFALSVAAISSLAAIATPFLYTQDWFDSGFGFWEVTTTTDAVLVAVAGLAVSWVLLFLGVALGRLNAVLARAMVSDPTGIVW